MPSGEPRTFERGSGPLVTVMIPTRGRPQELLQTLSSLHDLAGDPRLVEYLLKIDNDDTETINLALELSKLIPLEAVVSPRGNGYLDMHHWVNDLASKARGDWLYLFNDDARMKTENWAWLLAHADASGLWHGVDDVCLFVTPTIGRPFAQEFIMVRKRTFEILGHLAPNPHIDNWLYRVMHAINSAYYVAILVDHLSAEINDDTRQGALAAYKVTESTLNSVGLIRDRLKDTETLLRHVERNRRVYLSREGT